MPHILHSLKQQAGEKTLRRLRDLRSLFFKILDTPKGYVRSIRYCGYKLYYTKGAGLIDRIRLGNIERIYEKELCEKIALELNKHSNPLFIDIGANIGLISLYVASQVPQAKIYSFEPGHHQSSTLGLTLLANKLTKRVTLERMAVGQKDTLAEFHTYGEGDASGDGFVDTHRGDRPLSKVKVIETTLDTWWREHNKPDTHVVKIDTEGAEYFVLQGMKEVIKACKPVIFLEISLKNLEVYPHTYKDIFNFFNTYSYILSTLDGLICTEENIQEIVISHDSFIAHL